MLYKSSDRLHDLADHATAILCAAEIERSLTLLLKRRLHYDRKVYDAMFEGAGPLASFEAKINIAYLFGLIQTQTLKKLKLVGRIAKRLGDRANSMGFSSPTIEKLVTSLASSASSSAGNAMAADALARSHDIKSQYISVCSHFAERFSTAAARSEEPIRPHI